MTANKLAIIILAIACAALGAMAIKMERKAASLNDALYTANIETQKERMEKVEALNQLEECKREMEHLKRALEDEKEGKAALADRHDKYVQETESYIEELELDQIYNTRSYYPY